MYRTSTESPLFTIDSRSADPRGGKPLSVVSRTIAPSSTVSFRASDSPEQSTGQAAPPSSRSPHAASTSGAMSARIRTDRLCKPSTPSFDVEAVDDRHDHGVDWTVLGDRGLPCRASCRIENDLADAGADTIHRDDVAPLPLEGRREVHDDEQLERVERRILAGRDH